MGSDEAFKGTVVNLKLQWRVTLNYAYFLFAKIGYSHIIPPYTSE